ncbi:MAG: putative selenate ABC transporter substrate-binding protein [Planctomycetota bacterium]|nr:putative selenate ABC transporter substrate-binding protein [Planctomycetota bacterium]
MLTARVVLSFAGALFAAGLAACGGQSEAAAAGSLTFTAIPDDNATELRERFQQVADHLSRELGVEVRFFPTSSYDASVEAFKNGDVQLAWFGGLTGVQARNAVSGARAIAQGAIDPKFRSYFIAHKDTGIERGDAFPLALEGKTFTFGSHISTSGRLMPEAFIREHTGKSPEEFFGAANYYSGSHDKTAKLVESGTFQAGVLNYKKYDRLVAEGRIDPEVCRIVWVTPDYADYNWTAHPDLEAVFGAGFIERLQEALVGMKAPELLAAVDRAEGLIPASNVDFQAIEVLALELDFMR